MPSVIRDFINDHCIARARPGSQDLLSYDRKGWYTWQFYLRSALFEPPILEAIVDDFFERFDASLLNDVQIAGVESASTPMLTAIALRAASLGRPLNIFSIRKEQKGYGRRNWLEGRVLDKPVLVIDDLTSNNHKTMRHAIRILQMHDTKRVGVVYAVVYKSHTPEEPIVMGGETYIVEHMFSLKDFDLSHADYQRASREAIRAA